MKVSSGVQTMTVASDVRTMKLAFDMLIIGNSFLLMSILMGCIDLFRANETLDLEYRNLEDPDKPLDEKPDENQGQTIWGAVVRSAYRTTSTR